MAGKVTSEEIKEMHRLYGKYGNYSAVAKEMGRSPSTVAKYIKMKGTPIVVKETFAASVRK